jgi:two-component system sensor histidine kinase DegS
MDIDAAKAREELDKLKDALRFSLNDVRKIIYDLRPLVIEEEGLSAALENYIATWEEKNRIHTQFS